MSSKKYGLKKLGVKFLIISVFGISCEEPTDIDPLKKVLSSQSPKIKQVMDNLDAHEIQIRYTQIDGKKDQVIFTDFDFQTDSTHYFYPASTIKFPVAVAALEKINETDSLSLNTRFYIEGDSLETTFSQAIFEIFAVSDNAANNRLMEFLGQDNLNHRMNSKGVKPIRIAHRLSTPNADDVTTKPLIIYLNDSTTVHSQTIINTYPEALNLQKIEKGHGFYDEDGLQKGAFDFSLKNYYPVEAQHALLKRIIFPRSFPPEEQFNLGPEAHKMLVKAMHTLPSELGYDPDEYYDSYVKFSMFGDSKDPIPDHIKVYNKVGYAYGTLTDCAYIHDVKNDVDFMITATILVNKDGIFNDNAYEYDQIGVPFLAQLGRELYQYELKQKR